MSAEQPLEIRLKIARLHWELQEYDEALSCLERAVNDAPVPDELRSELDSYLEKADDVGVSPQLVARIRRAMGAEASQAERDFEPSSPLTTPTLARLLANQGHADRALAVTTRLLEQNPADERALAVKAELSSGSARDHNVMDELSRWLRNARRLGQERTHA